MRILALLFLLTLPAVSCAENIDSQLFVLIVACESSWDHKIIGDSGKSHSLPQFQKNTFEWLRKKAMRDQSFVKAFRLLEKRISMPVFKYTSHKMLVAQWAMSNGYGRHWECYRRLAIH